MNNIYKYINSSFKENQDMPHKQKILQKISSKFTKSISKEDNIKWLNSKLSTVFSQNLSTKIVRYKSNHNEKVINSVLQKGNDINAIFILNHTVKDMWNIYINDDINEATKLFKIQSLSDSQKAKRGEKFKKKAEMQAKMINLIQKCRWERKEALKDLLDHIFYNEHRSSLGRRNRQAHGWQLTQTVHRSGRTHHSGAQHPRFQSTS
jgi:hypothetical protein